MVLLWFEFVLSGTCPLHAIFVPDVGQLSKLNAHITDSLSHFTGLAKQMENKQSIEIR